MNNPSGSLLRDWRTARGLSLGALARRAGIGKSTLGDWETGRHQPRAVELGTVLDALDVPAAQRAVALASIGGPRGLRHLRAEGALRPPCAGDLLYAMRCRRAWTLSRVAAAVGVRESTVSRWERAEAAPSPENLERLCTALGAGPEERAALDAGSLTLARCAVDASLDELQAELSALITLNIRPDKDGLNDLKYLALEGRLWPLALRDPAAREVLLHAYLSHAEFLLSRHRIQEGARVADRAWSLAGSEPLRVRQGRALNIWARVAVHRQRPSTPERGLALLRAGFEYVRTPEQRARVLAAAADFLALRDHLPGARRLAARALAGAEEAGADGCVPWFRLTFARILQRGGEDEKAAAVLSLPGRPEDPLFEIFRTRVLAAAYRDAGDRDRQQQLLAGAQALAERHGWAMLAASLRRVAASNGRDW